MAPSTRRIPRAARRKSARFFRRSTARGGPMDWSKGRLGRELPAAGRAAAVQHLAAASGGHAGAEAVTALAHEFARLIGALHGSEGSERCERGAVLGASPGPVNDGWRSASPCRVLASADKGICAVAPTVPPPF